MKLHVVQKDITNRNLKPFLDQARDTGADVVCFGELATTGCLYQNPETVEDIKRVLEQFWPYDFAVMIGLPYRGCANLRNGYVYYHQGNFHVYNKINLFPPMNEPALYCPGDKPGVWQTPWGKVGIAICYDIRFPAVFEALSDEQVDFVFIPAAFPLVRIDDWCALLRQRAKEMGVPVVGINAVGDDGQNAFGGKSMVVAADGSVLAEADDRSETVLEISL